MWTKMSSDKPAEYVCDAVYASEANALSLCSICGHFLAKHRTARKIAADIYKHANYAGICYALIWDEIASAFNPKVERLRAIVEELVQYGGGMEYDDWRNLVQRAEEALK